MSKQGISLISVIITIIVIIILASIAIFTGFNTPDKAIFSRFTQEIDELRTELVTVRTNNFELYRDTDYGFEEVVITNAPEEFISASNDSNTVIGHVIDTNRIKDALYRGKGTHDSGVVVFDKDDVYVYDKNGTVFYAKGFQTEEYIYYNATAHKNTK